MLSNRQAQMQHCVPALQTLPPTQNKMTNALRIKSNDITKTIIYILLSNHRVIAFAVADATTELNRWLGLITTTFDNHKQQPSPIKNFIYLNKTRFPVSYHE